MKLPDKSSVADPLSVSMLKQVANDIAPFLMELFNRTLATGRFPSAFKEAFVTPVIKKPGLDAAEVTSYRPISNLSIISKLLERLVTKQFTDSLRSADLLPSLQSGFRPGHSTETATLRCFPTSLRPSTAVMLQHWSLWTCQLHSILSTMPYCVNVCRCPMVWVALCCSGFSHICAAGLSTLGMAHTSLPKRG